MELQNALLDITILMLVSIHKKWRTRNLQEDKQFLTKAKFAKLIERTVSKKRLSYMDAVIDLCGAHEVELEEVRKFISPVIKNKLEAEAMSLNFLPKGNQLPIE